MGLSLQSSDQRKTTDQTKACAAARGAFHLYRVRETSQATTVSAPRHGDQRRFSRGSRDLHRIVIPRYQQAFQLYRVRETSQATTVCAPCHGDQRRFSRGLQYLHGIAIPCYRQAIVRQLSHFALLLYRSLFSAMGKYCGIIGWDCDEPPEEGTHVINKAWRPNFTAEYTTREREEYESIFANRPSIKRIKIRLLGPRAYWGTTNVDSPKVKRGNGTLWCPGDDGYLLGRASFMRPPDAPVVIPDRYPQPPPNAEGDNFIFPPFTGPVHKEMLPEWSDGLYVSAEERRLYDVESMWLPTRYEPENHTKHPIIWQHGIDFRRDAWLALSPLPQLEVPDQETDSHPSDYPPSWGCSLHGVMPSHEDSSIPPLSVLAARAIVPFYYEPPPRLSGIASFKPDSKLILQVTAANGPVPTKDGRLRLKRCVSGDAALRVAYYEERATFLGEKRNYLTLYSLDSDHVLMERFQPVMRWEQAKHESGKPKDIWVEDNNPDRCVDSIHAYLEAWREFEEGDLHIHYYWAHSKNLPLKLWAVPPEWYLYPWTILDVATIQAFFRGVLLRRHVRRLALIGNRHFVRPGLAA